MKRGDKYNWSGQPERLAYLGRNRSGNGFWHQFEKVDEPGIVWCEVTDSDLHMLEETKDWVDEETYFERQRRDPKLEIIEKKWSEGSSPIMLVRCGYVAREEWEKCFWLKHPSEIRCWQCPHSGVCPSYIGGG